MRACVVFNRGQHAGTTRHRSFGKHTTHSHTRARAARIAHTHERRARRPIIFRKLRYYFLYFFFSFLLSYRRCVRNGNALIDPVEIFACKVLLLLFFARPIIPAPTLRRFYRAVLVGFHYFRRAVVARHGGYVSEDIPRLLYTLPAAVAASAAAAVTQYHCVFTVPPPPPPHGVFNSCTRPTLTRRSEQNAIGLRIASTPCCPLNAITRFRLGLFVCLFGFFLYIKCLSHC